MELHRLSGEGVYTSDYIVDGYATLIWTDRYRVAGEIQLTTYKIKETMGKMPLGSLFSLKDTREVMIVETHEIAADPDGAKVLTVSGRSFETFYENRPTLIAAEAINDSGGDANDITIEGHSSSYAALLTLNRAKSSLVSAVNDIPYVVNQDITTKTMALKDRTIERGDAYTAVLKLLAEDDLGIRVTRPIPGQENLVVYIYNGTDRTDSVIFDVKEGHFESTKYLWSIKNYKTSVYSSSTRYFTRANRAGLTDATGLARRVGVLDNSDITKAGTKYLNATQSRGRRYLAAHGKTAVFEGTVSPDVPYKYERDYNLGDIVMCVGEYGLSQRLMVTEHVRTQDVNGEKAYPTLSAIGGDYDD
jgi:hypothetical protein